MEIPASVPQPGFYYHHKRDPNGSVNNGVYEILSVGFYTEKDGEYLVNYRPLYQESKVYQASLQLGLDCVHTRPLKMWMEPITQGGKTFARFSRITDLLTLTRLQEVRQQMYGS